MRDPEERQKLYNFEKEDVEEGQDFYNLIVRENPQTFQGYILGNRIHAFRHGMFSTNKQIILKEISPNWIEFYNHSVITNKDFQEILKEYQDKEKAFIYLDPPYMDSFNAGYNQYQGQSHNEDYSIKDNTKMYIKLWELLQNAKAKNLFSINDCAITKHIYKDYVKDNYN